MFSVEHPILTSRPEQEWARGPDGNALYWPVDNYRLEGPRRTTWFVDGVVKYHRTVETYVNGLIAAGFTLRRLLEPAPPMETNLPAEMDLQRRRPPFRSSPPRVEFPLRPRTEGPRLTHNVQHAGAPPFMATASRSSSESMLPAPPLLTEEIARTDTLETACIGHHSCVRSRTRECRHTSRFAFMLPVPPEDQERNSLGSCCQKQERYRRVPRD